jgi:hypothetical protein
VNKPRARAGSNGEGMIRRTGINDYHFDPIGGSLLGDCFEQTPQIALFVEGADDDANQHA